MWDPFKSLRLRVFIVDSLGYNNGPLKDVIEQQALNMLVQNMLSNC